MYSVALKDMIEKMDLENCTPEIDISEIKISHTDVNRPALQLAGFFDYFDRNGVLCIEWSENIPDLSDSFNTVYRVTISKTGEESREITIEKIK